MLSSVPNWAQKVKPPKFGNVGIEDVRKEVYEIDTNAVAIIIYEKETNSFGPIYSNTYSLYKRIKILKEEGLKYAQINLPYFTYPNNEILKENISAFTYNINNNELIKTKMDEGNVTNVLVSQLNGIIKFKIPEVKVGSIIEYKITLSSNQSFRLFDGWYFQHEIPTIWSETETSLPNYIDFAPIFNGSPDMLIKESTKNASSDYSKDRPRFGYNTSKHKFTMMNIAAFRKEPYSKPLNFAYRLFFMPIGSYPLTIITDPNNEVTVNKGEYEKAPNSWETIAQSHLLTEDFGGFIKSKLFKKEFKNIQFNSDSILDKVNTIYKYIGKNYNLDKGQTLSINRSAEKLIRTKRGKASDLNLFLVALLQNAGLEAYSTIITTHPHPQLDPLIPILPEFPKAICVVKITKGINYFIDMSSYPSNPEFLPIEDLNGLGLILKGEPLYEWAYVKSYGQSSNWNNVNLKVKNDSLFLNIEMDHKGYIAQDHVNVLTFDKNIYIKNEFARFKVEPENVKLNINLLPSTEIDNYRSIVSFKTNLFIEKRGDTILIDPLLGFGLNYNPFIDSIRNYPVDFYYTSDDIYQLNLELPKGYTTNSLPEPIRLKNSDNSVKFLYAWEIINDKLKLIYKLNIKRQIFELEEYETLRNIFRILYEKSKEKLVLIKSPN